jgi:hypothetical protein
MGHGRPGSSASVTAGMHTTMSAMSLEIKLTTR